MERVCGVVSVCGESVWCECVVRVCGKKRVWCECVCLVCMERDGGWEWCTKNVVIVN